MVIVLMILGGVVGLPFGAKARHAVDNVSTRIVPALGWAAFVAVIAALAFFGLLLGEQIGENPLH